MLLFLERLMGAVRRGHVMALVVSFVVVVLAGAGLFALTQGPSFGTGLYWAVTTATTVGYGDVTPHNGIGRVLASVFMLITIPMLGALFAIAAGISVSAGLRRIMRHESEFPAGTYRLVIGDHPSALAIVESLAQADDAVVLVADLPPEALPERVHLVRGDPTDPHVIARARPAGAVHALVAGRDDGDVLVSTILLRRLAPDVPTAVLTNSGAVREALDDLGVDQTISSDDLVAHALAKMLETPHVGKVIDALFDSDSCKLVEVEVRAEDVGRPLSALRSSWSGLVLGMVNTAGVTMGIADDPTATDGDRLLIAVTTEPSVPPQGT